MKLQVLTLFLRPTNDQLLNFSRKVLILGKLSMVMSLIKTKKS